MTVPPRSDWQQYYVEFRGLLQGSSQRIGAIFFPQADLQSTNPSSTRHEGARASASTSPDSDRERPYARLRPPPDDMP